MPFFNPNLFPSIHFNANWFDFNNNNNDNKTKKNQKKKQKKSILQNNNNDNKRNKKQTKKTILVDKQTNNNNNNNNEVSVDSILSFLQQHPNENYTVQDLHEILFKQHRKFSKVDRKMC